VQTTVPKLIPSDMDRMLNITLQTESGGQRYGKDGQLLTSSAGAKGEMQVMDGTNKDPGFGVKPAKDNSPEERARVGRDYLAAMVTRYSGDPSKAWAAYNAGPGAVDDAMMRAKASRTPGADWLTFMPNETQAYVAKNVKALQSGGGTPAVPTLMDVHAQVRDQLGPDAKPQVVQAAIQEATRRWEDISKAKTARDDQNVAEAQRLLIANGGRMDALPPSLRTAVPPGKYDDLMGFAEKLSKGVPVQTNMAIYQRLSDPQTLAALTDGEFFRLKVELSESDFKHFATEREKLKTGPKANDPGQLDSSTIKSTLDNRLNQMRIDTTPKDGSDDAGRVGAIRAFVNASIANAQLSTGKKLNDVEIAQHIDGLFAKSLAFKHTVLGFKADDVKNQMLAMRLADIPGDTVDSLKADFASQGIPSPTEGQILGAYWTLKTLPRIKKP
jgi:soluble lytic murein transglycosylase